LKVTLYPDNDELTKHVSKLQHNTLRCSTYLQLGKQNNLLDNKPIITLFHICREGC